MVKDAPSVLHLASGDLWAGAEVQIFYLVRELARKSSIRVQVALLNDGELAHRLRSEGVVVTIFDEKSLSAFRILRRLVELVRRARINVIHTHRFKENLIGGIASRACAAVSLRTVHGSEEHNPSSLFSRRGLTVALDRFAGNHLQDVVVGVSQALSSDLKRRFGATRVAFIPNGIDVELVRKTGLPTSIHRSPIRIGLVGRMVPVKRVDIFLMVAEELTRRDPGRFEFMVVGDGPLLAELKESASNRRLVNVSFLGFREDSLKLIGELDILMITSDHEGLPMVVLESLALGVPVIAHAVGGLNEVITSSRQGRLVPSQNERAFADEVQHMAASFSDKSESLLPTRLDIVATANEYTCLYDRLLARKPLNRP